MVLPSPSLNNATVNAPASLNRASFIEIDDQNVGASLRKICASADYYGATLICNSIFCFRSSSF
ncbi:hypothetical protein BT69DRAFT_1288380 [Atractiella rhizophila]|nr:hypothetical protein BT69DRAFT_1288380 [Atractiella rhizophila]